MVAFPLAFLLLALSMSVLLRRSSLAPKPVAADVLEGHNAVAAVRRRAGRWQAGGVVAGLIAAAIAADSNPLGRGTALAAPLFAVLLLVGVLVGELVVRAPSAGMSTTTLRVRRAVDYVPRRLGAAVALATVGLGGLLACTTAAGSADDMGRPGRSLVRGAQATGPWPGSFYSVPLTAAAAFGLLAALLTLAQIARRPRAGGSVALEQVDEALRRRSGERVTASVGVLSGVPLLGVALLAAGGLLRISARPMWWSVAGALLLVTAALSLVLLAWSAAVLLTSAGVGARGSDPGDAA